MLYETPYVLQCGRLTGLWTHLVMPQMYLKQIIYENCGNEIKWRMILAVVNAIYASAWEAPKKYSTL